MGTGPRPFTRRDVATAGRPRARAYSQPTIFWMSPTTTPPTVLITGATDGLGLALARHYHSRGVRLVLVGRRPLADLSAPLFRPDTYCQLDLADNSQYARLYTWLRANGVWALDQVIHNAGVGWVGPIGEQPPTSIRELVAVNLLAPIHLTHGLFPWVQAAAGLFTFIGSVVAALPAPHYAVYAATKAALAGFVRNLQTELAACHPNVQAQIIHPGAIRTDMHAKSGADLQSLPWPRFPTAETVAQAVIRQMEGRVPQAVIGPGNRLAFWAGHHLPDLTDGISGRVHRHRRPIALPSPQSPEEKPRHCVITGAADGIGRALAHRFGRAGYQVTGIDVDWERAMYTQAELVNAGVNARFALADLADPQAVEQLLETLIGRPPIDVLIHNAGINAVGPFVTSDLTAQERVLAVNLAAPLRLTAGLLGTGQLAHGCTVVALSSLSHFVGYPGAAVYAASKDGLATYMRSLSMALADHHGHTLTVFPGPTRTAHARRYSPDNRREHRRMPPEEVADAIYRAVHRRRRRLIPGRSNRLFALVGRLAPGLAAQIMRRTLFEQLVRQDSIR